jgi:phosphatidate cytidylyltransferase
MHLKRLIVAVILLPLLYLFIMHLPPEYFFCVVLAVTFIALSEFYSMYRITGMLKYSCLFLGISIVGISYLRKDVLYNVLILSIMIIIVIRLFVKKNPGSSLHDISRPALGLLYIPGLFSFHTQIRMFGPEWIIFLYASVWAADSMAYFLGTTIGKRKLYPEVSPNKTIAGAVGSLAGGFIAALLIRTTLIPSLAVLSSALAGIIIGGITIIGDLAESMFKRDAGVKDSGLLIPGHGGILDKIDGALFAGPALYWLLLLLGIK